MISPQNLGGDLLAMLSQTRLRHLHVLQNRYTPADIGPVHSFDWKHCAKSNPALRVHLRVESIRDRQVLWQPGAPVFSIIYKSPNTRVSVTTTTANRIYRIIRIVGCGLSHKYGARSNERMKQLYRRWCFRVNCFLFEEFGLIRSRNVLSNQFIVTNTQRLFLFVFSFRKMSFLLKGRI